MTVAERCGGCQHAAHRSACPGKAPSGCVTLYGQDGNPVGIACGSRPPCPCYWRNCACGHPVALAAELPPEARALPENGQVMIVSVERGSAHAADGRLAVRILPGGVLACRDLTDGEEPGTGEWRGREHTGDCGMLKRSEANPRWLTLR